MSKLLLILQALRMISIKILLVISMFFIKQISDDNKGHHHTRSIWFILQQLFLPSTYIGNVQGQQMRISILIAEFTFT